MQINSIYNTVARSVKWETGLLTKTLLVMKLTFILLATAILQVNAKGTAQVINYSAQSVSLEKVFAVIKTQTGFSFFYDKNDLAKTTVVDVNFINTDVRSALNILFVNQGLRYEIKDKTVFINPIPAVDLKSTAATLAPPIDIHGRVLNENGEPLVGASVSVKGTNLVAVADEKGYYTVGNVTEGEYTLIVTYVGYKSMTKMVKVGANANVALNFELELNAQGFNEIIVSANLVASKKREIASAVTTISSEVIEKLPINNVAELFRGEVPGGNFWSPEPGNTTNSIKFRGDIDFYSNATTVKIFIDGIELANASYLSTLPLSSIDHIEILHGPQASTLYGSGATSGVVYIFTKKGKVGGPHINAKVSAGTIASKWVDKTAWQQDHSLNISGGSEDITYNFGGSYFHYDPYWQDGNNTNTSGFGSVKAKQGNFTAEMTGQYSTRKAGIALNPILKDSFPTIPNFIIPFYSSTTSIQQTLGLNIIYSPFRWWQHNASIGNDQNNISFVRTTPRYTDPSDTLNFKNNISLSKKSYRYYTTLKIPTGNFFKSTITAGLDHYLFEQTVFSAQGLGTDPNFLPISNSIANSLQKYSNTGFYAQGLFGFADKLFLTAGIRSESTKQFGNSSGASVAPRAGASFVINWGNIMLKPRVSYGKSINVPDPSQFVEKIIEGSGYTFHQLANPDLKPQEQTGYDIGFDAEFGKGLGTLEATYYNQTVNNFIIAITDFSNYPIFISQFVNVGKIKNSGLELAGTLNLNPIKFRFTYSITNSIVKDISNTSYTNFYQNGDRIWGVPKSNGGATVVYTFPSLFNTSSNSGGNISLGVTYFGRWVYRDQIGQTKDYVIYSDYSKTEREYTINYPSFVLFRLAINYNINKNVGAFLSINNLFNSQQFEYINTNPTQGRVTMIGLRINY